MKITKNINSNGGTYYPFYVSEELTDGFELGRFDVDWTRLVLQSKPNIIYLNYIVQL